MYLTTSLGDKIHPDGRGVRELMARTATDLLPSERTPSARLLKTEENIPVPSVVLPAAMERTHQTRFGDLAVGNDVYTIRNDVPAEIKLAKGLASTNQAMQNTGALSFTY